MAALNFPTEESLGRPLESGDTYNAPNNVEYIYDGVKWVAQTNTSTGEYLTTVTQDRVAPMFVNGNNTGITFSYDAETNTLTSEVTGAANLGLFAISNNILGTVYDTSYSDMYLSPDLDGNVQLYLPTTENALEGAEVELKSGYGNIRLTSGLKSWILDTDGNTSFPSLLHLNYNDSEVGFVDPTENGVLFGAALNKNIAIQTDNDGNNELGQHTWLFGSDGILRLPGSIIASGGRYYQDCSESWTSLRWVNANTDGEPIELVRVYSDGGIPYTGDESESNERIQFGYQEIGDGLSSFYIITTQNENGINGEESPDDHKWIFRGDGNLALPGGLNRGTQTLTLTDISEILPFQGLIVGLADQDNSDLIIGSGEQGLAIQGSGAVLLQAKLNSDSPVIITGSFANTDATDGGDVQIYGGGAVDGTEGRVFVQGSEVIVGASSSLNLWAGDNAEWNFYGEDSSMVFPDGTAQYTAYQGSTIVSDTAPTEDLGRLWFNSLDGRMYVLYDNNWVDTNPAVIPSPETYLDGLTIEGTSINTVEIDQSVNIATNLTVTGDIEVTGDVIPDTNHQYSLGTENRRWAELYVDVIDGGTASSWLLPV